MIGEFERYHGAVVRDLIVCAAGPIEIEASDDLGRVNSFLVNNRIAIYLKHSAKRLPPWQFTYLPEHLEELTRLCERADSVWLLNVCGQDGVVALSLEEFFSVNRDVGNETAFVRVDRGRNTMYRVNGNAGKLAKSKRRGLRCVVEQLGG